MGNQQPPPAPFIRAAAAGTYALHRGMGAWQLTFAGAATVLKHEQGILYVARLLYQPRESIHGLDLAAAAAHCPAAASEVRLDRGVAVLERHARIQERSATLDDAETLRSLRRKERELEAILDDDDELEPVKAEALRELQSLAEYQRRHGRRQEDNAQRAVRAVRRALYRFHAHLAEASDATGQPHPLLRSFGEHVDQYLLIPSSRFGSRAARRRAGCAGCFRYEPPTGIVWK